MQIKDDHLRDHLLNALSDHTGQVFRKPDKVMLKFIKIGTLNSISLNKNTHGRAQHFSQGARNDQGTSQMPEPDPHAGLAYN